MRQVVFEFLHRWRMPTLYLLYNMIGRMLSFSCNKTVGASQDNEIRLRVQSNHFHVLLLIVMAQAIPMSHFVTIISILTAVCAILPYTVVAIDLSRLYGHLQTKRNGEWMQTSLAMHSKAQLYAHLYNIMHLHNIRIRSIFLLPGVLYCKSYNVLSVQKPPCFCYNTSMGVEVSRAQTRLLQTQRN